MTYTVTQPAETARLTAEAERLELENARLNIPARITVRCLPLGEESRRCLEAYRAKMEMEDE